MKLRNIDEATDRARAKRRDAREEEEALGESWQKKKRRWMVLKDGVEQGDEVYQKATEILCRSEKLSL